MDWICDDARRQIFGLTESTGNVVFGPFLFRVSEDLSRPTNFNQLAFEEERRLVADSRCLLHVVSYDDNRVLST